MRKLVLLLVTVLAFNLSNAQEIKKTEAPIYEGNGITVKNFSSDSNFILLFRNDKYKYIYDYKSVVFDSYDDLVLFLNKIIEILEFPKTSKDEDLEVNINKSRLIRYGFAQKKVYIRAEGGYKSVSGWEAKSILNSLKEQKQ